MTSLEKWGIGIQINPPAVLPPRYEYILKDAEWPEAVNIAIRHREHHPTEAVELWPIGDTHRVHVVREVKA